MNSNCLNVMPGEIRDAVARELDEKDEEIRIRANRPIMLLGPKKREIQYNVTSEECERMLELVCGYSVFAYERELKESYITLEDGSRVGIAGKLTPAGMTMPHSFNIRLARQIKGAGNDFIEHITKNGIHSALLLSEPGAGKTTVLRDAARQLSQLGYKVGIADERGEIAAGIKGIPALDIGLSDVMSGCSKAMGMMLLLRGMSPQILITDEIASQEDGEAVMEASGCGVRVIASAHGSGVEVLRRKGISRAIHEGAFEKILLLKNEGKSRSITDITEDVICVGQEVLRRL